MFELEKSTEVQRLIDITKSSSGFSGPDLVRAHIELGRILSGKMPFPPEDTTVVAVLRSGLFFAEGIYLGLGCKFQLFDPKHEMFERPKTKYTVLADAVINSGKTLKGLVGPDIFVACCVINKGAVPLFDDRLFTVRTSSNSFVGGNVKKQEGTIGPDTTMRLFNLL